MTEPPEGRCGELPADVRQLAELLERRWLISVLYAAHTGAVRFTDFRRALGRVPPATLTQRLVELEEAGMLRRVVVDTRPPSAEYRLTTEGVRLAPLVDALATCTRQRGRRR